MDQMEISWLIGLMGPLARLMVERGALDVTINGAFLSCAA
jgi:hypothetical protein